MQFLHTIFACKAFREHRRQTFFCAEFAGAEEETFPPPTFRKLLVEEIWQVWVILGLFFDLESSSFGKNIPILPINSKDFNATAHPWSSVGGLHDLFFRRVEALSAEGLREHPALISYDDTGEESERMSYQEPFVTSKRGFCVF